MEIPLSQTKNWQKLQNDLGETTFYKETENFSFLAILKPTKFGSYLYLPYGPFLKSKNKGPELKNAAKAAYAALEALAKQKNIIFIRIEPQAAETASYWANLKNSVKTKDLSPKVTWVLDLTPEKSTLISNFTQGTRTCYNQFTKKGITVTKTKKPSDIKYLVDLQKKLAHQKNFGIFSEKYLKTELKQDFATLYLAHFEKKVIAAALFFDDKNTRYYMQSAADMEYKKLPATVALLTTAIFDAKEKGLKNFDFWGVLPADASGNVPKNHPWSGFTKFKRSFGGKEVHYVGTYDLVMSPVKYRLYSLARHGNRFLRKVLKK